MRSVLVIVTRQIGDVLLTTPLVRQARVLWPAARIDVLGFQGTLGMLAGNPDIDQRIEVPQRLGFAGTRSLLRRLWRQYDLALIADPGDRAHLIGWIASATRAGMLPVQNSSNWWKRRLLVHPVSTAGDQGATHVAAEKLRLVEPWLDPGRPAPAPRLVAPAGVPLPESLINALLPGYVVMHAPSMWPYKQWPLEHFRDLAVRLAAAGRQVVLTGGPGPQDRECIAAIQGAGADYMLVDAGTLTFSELSTLLREAALYIGPDTSISHLAAACGTPVLAIFGPTNPQRWAPWPGGERVRFERRALRQTVGHVTLLQADLPCVPCGRAGCEDHRHSRSECLPAILPARVAQEALKLLAR